MIAFLRFEVDETDAAMQNWIKSSNFCIQDIGRKLDVNIQFI